MSVSPNSRVQKAMRLLKVSVWRRVHGVLSGEFRSAFKGRSLEYVELREYQPGDDVRCIDWSATARIGRPFVRVFWEYKQLDVFVLLDTSASMHAGPLGQAKNKLAKEIVALLVLSAVKNQSSTGFALYAEGLEYFIPPRKGLMHAHKILEQMVMHCSSTKTASLSKTLETLHKRLRPKSVVFILSDFDDLGDLPFLKSFAATHDVIGVRICHYQEIPQESLGLIGCYDVETGDWVWVDACHRPWREKMRQEVFHEAAKIKGIFRRAGADFVEIYVGQDYLQPFFNLFRLRLSRARQRMQLR